MADERQIKRQEQILTAKQQQLERLDRSRELMLKQVEKEAQILEDMLKSQHGLTDAMNSQGTTPPNAGTIPVDFKSQYDQFTETDSTSLSKVSAIDFTTREAERDSRMEVQKVDEPSYSTFDRSEHWQTLTENPGVPVFATGKYVSTGHGSHQINNSNEYEYEVSVSALPLSVGDIVRVPVHPTGHGDGKAITTSHMQFQVNDIYTNKKFHLYHDRIE